MKLSLLFYFFSCVALASTFANSSDVAGIAATRAPFTYLPLGKDIASAKRLFPMNRVIYHDKDDFSHVTPELIHHSPESLVKFLSKQSELYWIGIRDKIREILETKGALKTISSEEKMDLETDTTQDITSDKTLHVVDLHCSTGLIASKILTEYSNVNITCVDLEYLSLLSAAHQYPSLLTSNRLTLQHGLPQRTTLKSNSIDLVLGLGLYESIYDIDGLTKEIRRFLNKDGVALLLSKSQDVLSQFGMTTSNLEQGDLSQTDMLRHLVSPYMNLYDTYLQHVGQGYMDGSYQFQPTIIDALAKKYCFDVDPQMFTVKSTAIPENEWKSGIEGFRELSSPYRLSYILRNNRTSTDNIPIFNKLITEHREFFDQFSSQRSGISLRATMYFLFKNGNSNGNSNEDSNGNPNFSECDVNDELSPGYQDLLQFSATYQKHLDKLEQDQILTEEDEKNIADLAASLFSNEEAKQLPPQNTLEALATEFFKDEL